MMAAMHEHVHQWARQQDQVGQRAQQMSSVFLPQEPAATAANTSQPIP
jgi:hypothetical protein